MKLFLEQQGLDASRVRLPFVVMVVNEQGETRRTVLHGSVLHQWLDGLVNAYLRTAVPEDVERRLLAPTVGPYILRMAAFAFRPTAPAMPTPPAAADAPSDTEGMDSEHEDPPAGHADDDVDESGAVTAMATVPQKASRGGGTIGSVLTAVSQASKERERMVAANGASGASGAR